MNRLKKIALIVSISLLSLSASAQLNYNFKPFGEAVRFNDVATMQTMLDNGTSPNEMQNVTTPLGIATDRNHDEAFDLLMAQPSIEVNTVFTIEYLGAGYENAVIKNALLCAVDSRNIRMANILLDRGAQADFFYTSKRTDGTAITGTTLTNVMRIPVSDESLALAQRIADKTTNLNRKFNYIGTPEVNLLYRLLSEERCADYNSVVKTIIDRGASVKGYFFPSNEGLEAIKKYGSPSDIAAYQHSAKYIYTSCPLLAAQKGNDELLAYMIDKGASVDYKDDKGAILMINCTTAKCVEVLMQHGIDINVQHPTTGWPLIFTAAGLNNSLLEDILKLGADPNIEVNGLRTLDAIRGTTSKTKKRAKKILVEYGYNL